MPDSTLFTNTVAQNPSLAAVLDTIKDISPVVVITFLKHTECDKHAERSNCSPATNSTETRNHLNSTNNQEVKVSELAELKDELLRDKIIDSIATGADKVADIRFPRALVGKPFWLPVIGVERDMAAIW
jgi:hypothetical protein